MPDKKGKQRIEYLSDYVVFDLETTGTSCNTDQVVEISAIKVKDNKVENEFSALVNPGCSIPFWASQVNGITDDMVADAPDFRTVLSDFLDFAGNLPLVGHNIHAFDLKFIYRDCELYFGRIPENDYVDTLKIARLCLPDIKHHTLTDLADHYGIPSNGAHRAMADCRMNQAIYEKLGSVLLKNPDLVKKCPKCGDLLVKRNGKYGQFWGCSGYPECHYTRNC